MKNKYIFGLLLFSVFIGCTSMDPAPEEDSNIATPATSTNTPQPVDQQKLIEDYVKKNKLKGGFMPSGLYVVVDAVGTGDFPTSKSTVKVEYTGYLLDGTKFDGTTSGSPIEFGLNQVIAGWTEGIAMFKKGGKGKLIIPSNLGYGAGGQGPIPPNSVLVFDVFLVDFK